ncbi:secreted protein [Paraglaciecola sp. T6c]|uniref:hypothetical protein n=1 Tax=Pseudoalteromonas atlantica (strain T6c / ATCC BAA-1087) TaxID=3042615 RepID=UPI00005C6E6D|nr:hypothetical protein [Paraglaciecola sp. T6c]ABG40959.1 secreted protein [Paraglaciecola sp. T6c]
MNKEPWLISPFISMVALMSCLISSTTLAKEAPLVSIPTHDAFFTSIAQYCGKAFGGKVAVDNQPSSAFDAKLVMFVRTCTPSELHIPFYVGDNASRTWIIKKTGSGLSLKHDHRHKDGTDDPVTMYGGHTLDAGYKQIQSFPADEYSKMLFAEQGLAQSITNTWQIFIYPDVFSYRLIREGREFRVDFDLTKPIPQPDAPWGY